MEITLQLAPLESCRFCPCRVLRALKCFNIYRLLAAIMGGRVALGGALYNGQPGVEGVASV